MVVGELLITPTVEICIQQLGRVEEMVWLSYDAILIMYALSHCVVTFVSDIAIFVLKRDAKLQLTNYNTASRGSVSGSGDSCLYSFEWFDFVSNKDMHMQLTAS